MALKYFNRALKLYENAQIEHSKLHSKDNGAEHTAAELHYSKEHINLLLEISKVYKIMGLLQPDTDEVSTSSAQ